MFELGHILKVEPIGLIEIEWWGVREKGKAEMSPGVLT